MGVATVTALQPEYDTSRQWLRAETNGVEMYTRQEDGWCGMSVRGLARACGADESSIRQALGLRGGTPPKWAQTFEPQCIRVAGYGSENHIVAVKETTCVRFLVHFARRKTEAMDTLAGFAAMGLRRFIHDATNYQAEGAFRDPVVIAGLYHQALQENDDLRRSERQAREAADKLCDIAKSAIADNETLKGRALMDEDLKNRTLMSPGLRILGAAVQEAELPMGDRALYKVLREEGFLSRRKDTWNYPTKKGRETGAFKLISRDVEIGGRPQKKMTTLVTDEGVEWLRNKYGGRTDLKEINLPQRQRIESISQRAGLSLESKDPDDKESLRGS